MDPIIDIQDNVDLTGWLECVLDTWYAVRFELFVENPNNMQPGKVVQAPGCFKVSLGSIPIGETLKNFFNRNTFVPNVTAL